MVESGSFRVPRGAQETQEAKDEESKHHSKIATTIVSDIGYDRNENKPVPQQTIKTTHC